MPTPAISLNTLRVFEAAARHLSFTQAAGELCVTQAAVSHQIRTLEAQLGQPLFVRTPRALQLSEAGQQLLPALQQGLGLIERALQQLATREAVERLTLGVVGTFAHGFLFERLPAFEAEHPGVQLRLLTHNNRVDLLAEGLDAAVRFGDGAWRSEAAQALMPAPLAPLCAPATAARLREPLDLRGALLLRSFRANDWDAWAEAAGVDLPPARGAQFDSSVLMVQAALAGEGVALAPPAMFQRELREGRLVQPFAATVDVGRYWLTWPLGKPMPPALERLRAWLLRTMPA
jgi:LysR family transcriptional regulator, regulator of gene expression of beta-lactamase